MNGATPCRRYSNSILREGATPCRGGGWATARCRKIGWDCIGDFRIPQARNEGACAVIRVIRVDFENRIERKYTRSANVPMSIK